MSATTQIPQIVPPGLLAAAGFFRLTVDEYHEMIRNNILGPDDKVELLDGYLVNKMSQNTPHSSTVGRLTGDLARLLPAGWQPRIQLPVTLSGSEPEPDAAVVCGDRRAFDARQPGPSDFGIVIEVADSSLALDRSAKGILYAGDALPEYWVVNIPDRQVEVYTDPDPTATPPAYRTRTDYRLGDAVPVVLGGQVVGAILVADLLP